jgi:hypothetical protein
MVVGEYYAAVWLNHALSEGASQFGVEGKKLTQLTEACLARVPHLAPRMKAVVELYKQSPAARGVVFCGTRACAMISAQVLEMETGISTAVVVGGSSRDSREAVEQFRRGKIQVLTGVHTTSYTHTHTYTQAHTRTYTHIHTHTHTHTHTVCWLDREYTQYLRSSLLFCLTRLRLPYP